MLRGGVLFGFPAHCGEPRSAWFGANAEGRAVLGEVAAKYSIDPESIDAALYSDLRPQAILQSFSKLSAAQLLERYDLAQYQAVPLGAVRVHAWVRFTSPADYRQLFRPLQFRRLLHTIQKDGSGYQLDIDGPFRLFDTCAV